MFRLRPALLALLGLALAAPAAEARDATVTSYDGTKITTHFFATKRLVRGHAPTILMGPGWSSPGATDTSAQTDTASGVVGVGTLLAAGYNVVTWDPRGFGSSGGTVTVDWAGNEGRDVQAIISWVARQRGVWLDRRGDPRMGMTGGSYGGGIQLVTAAIDRRVDAIVPDIAWHSLRTSLYKADMVKVGWASLLYNAGQTRGRLDPHIGSAYRSGATSGRLSQEDLDWFVSRGPGRLVGRIRVPTLLIQGTVDGLFTLDEAITNYAILRRNGVPTKMLWFCGGHGTCLTNPGDTSRIERATMRWLARYVKRRRSVGTGSRFEWLDQDGRSASAGDYPLRTLAPLVGTGSGTLPLTAAGGSGPATNPNGNGGPTPLPVTPAKAANAVNVRIPAPAVRRSVLGAPRVSLTYAGNALEPDTWLQAQIVDDRTGIVLGNQITPIPVTLDGKAHTVSRRLETLAATAEPGRTFTLQVVAQSTAYGPTRPLAGAVTLSKVRVELPVADRRRAPPGYRVRQCRRTVAVTITKRYRGRFRSARVVFRGRTVLRFTSLAQRPRLQLRGRPGFVFVYRTVVTLRSGRQVTETHRTVACP